MEKVINDYISKTDWRLHENANTAYSLSGLKSYIAATVLAKDSLSKLPEKIREAHKIGAIHIHDLDSGLWTPYCISGGTGIQTPSGSIPAKNVKVGDVLIGYNEKIGRFEHTTVEKVFCHETNEIYKLRVKRSDSVDGNLQITGNHKVLTDTGWKSVEELNIGDEILYLTRSRQNDSKRNRIEKMEGKKTKRLLTKEEISKIQRENHTHNSGEYSSKRWNEEGYKENVINKRKVSGHYEKVSEFMKLHNPMKNPEICRKTITKIRKSLADLGLVSKPQRNLYNLVKSIYPETELEYPVKTNKNIRFIDVAIPSLKIAIEYDGKYWHSLKEKDDIKRETELKEEGWEIYRFNEDSEINYDTINKFLSEIIPENGAVVISKKLLVAKSVGKRNYKYKVYNFHCTPHENYLANSMIVHNCYGADLQQLLLEGLKNPVGSSSTPAKHLDTAIDHIVNYIYISQSEFNGAQAFSNVDTLLAPFAIGMNYIYIKQQIQRLIYNISYPLRSAFQTPFFNASFDLIPPEHMKNEPIIIGGKTDKNLTCGDMQKEMDMINKAFLELMIEGDSKGRPFTFPIPTYGITKDVLNKNDDVTRLLYTLAAKFGSPNFQNYIGSGNDPSDVRSMCPIGGDEKVLIRSDRYQRLEFSRIGSLGKRENYEVYSDGKFVKGKFKRYENQNMIRVNLVNGHSIEMTTEHLNYVRKKNGENIEVIKGKDLTTDMYLPYSLNIYKGMGGSEEFGFFVGAFAGDGSAYEDGSSIGFSLCSEGIKNEKVKNRLIYIAEKYFGAKYLITYDKRTKGMGLCFYSKSLVGMCRDFVVGIKTDRHYDPKIYDMSEEFRRGVLLGHSNTDGSCEGRIYTSSKKMVETINMLSATLGLSTRISIDERTDTLGNYPNGVRTHPSHLICILDTDRNSYGNDWFKKDNKVWRKIKSIVPITKHTAYCFEIEGDEPMFTVGTTGILTHNCRLSLDIAKLKSRGLWNMGNKTGSLGVVTINLNHASKDGEEHFLENIDTAYDLSVEELLIKHKYIHDSFYRGLLPFTRQYLPEKDPFKTFFNTIGIVGMNEACINMFGSTIESNSEFVVDVLKHLRHRTDETTEETGLLFNLEETPCEGAVHRLAKLDKKLGLKIQGDGSPYLTNSTHCPVNTAMNWIQNVRIQEKFKQFYSGGTVLHGFVGEEMSPKSAEFLIKQMAIETKIPYYNLTPTFSMCKTHGYQVGNIPLCPKCNEENLIYSRVVGYLQPVLKWNDGKKSEFKDRKLYKMN